VNNLPRVGVVGCRDGDARADRGRLGQSHAERRPREDRCLLEDALLLQKRRHASRMRGKTGALSLTSMMATRTRTIRKCVIGRTATSNRMPFYFRFLLFYFRSINGDGVEVMP